MIGTVCEEARCFRSLSESGSFLSESTFPRGPFSKIQEKKPLCNKFKLVNWIQKEKIVLFINEEKKHETSNLLDIFICMNRNLSKDIEFNILTVRHKHLRNPKAKNQGH